MTTIEPYLFGNRPAVRIANDQVETIVVTGGGHIASFKRAGGDINAMWAPAWPTMDPALRVLADPDNYGSSGEEGLLSSILGHNLCVDVFGSHSPGEQSAGMTLHGESGMVTWEVAAVDHDSGTVVLSARLPHASLQIDRAFVLREGADQVLVEESVTNQVGFERVIGRQQHATIGRPFLEPRPTLFACNADRGVTFPTPEFDTPETFAPDREFSYPHIPQNDGNNADWRLFPRHGPAGNLCTLRINPRDELGWAVAANMSHGLALVYVWDREAVPWLMTWEEDRMRAGPPWNGNEITRGLEFGSYAFPTNRRDCVQRGTLLETPAFEWLDAYETKSARFLYALLPVEEMTEAPILRQAGGRAVEAIETDWEFSLA